MAVLGYEKARSTIDADAGIARAQTTDARLRRARSCTIAA
jgi:hypothetical protein